MVMAPSGTLTPTPFNQSGQIHSYDLTTTVQALDLRGATRIQLRVSGDDVRISYSEAMNDGDFFLMADGTNAIYDPGMGLTAGSMFGDSVFIRADSGTATIYVWKFGIAY